MSLASGKQYSVGARHGQVFELDDSGNIAATSTTPYEGFLVNHPKAFSTNFPNAKRIQHMGGDRVLAQDFLPPSEGSSATLRLARNDHDLYAMLSGTKGFAVGEAAVIGYRTSSQGFEPDVALIIAQQSKDAITLKRRWRSYIIPVATVNAKGSSMDENPAEAEYEILPMPTSKHLWGPAFSDATEGFTESEVLETMTEGFPWVTAWKADGTEDEFLFAASHQATATTKINVITVAGSVITSGVTKAVTGLTFAVAPTAGQIVVAFYEIAKP